MPGKLNAADSMSTPLVNNNLKVKIYFGIELAWHQVGLASSQGHRVGDIESAASKRTQPVRERVRNTVENDGGAHMVVVLTLDEMSYLLIGIFDDLVPLLCIFIGDMKIFDCTVCCNSAIARKGAVFFLNSYNLFR